MARVLKIKIDGDTKGLKGALDEAEGHLSSFGSKVTGFAGNMAKAGVLAGAVGVGVAGAFGASAIQSASNFAETVSKVGVLFGDAAPQIEAFADTAAKTFGQSKQQALDAAATFATFGKSAGLSGAGLTKFSTEFVGLASDMASFSNSTPEEAIDAIGAALRGEAEPIRRFGVLLDDATLRQQAFKLGIISSTKEALTPQQKVLAAQAAIYEQTSAAQGDFARTSDGLANKQRILSAQFADVKTTIGEKLLPVALTLATFVSDKLIPLFERWGPVIAEKVGAALTALAGFVRDEVVPAVQRMAGFVRDEVLPALERFSGWIQSDVIPAVQQLAGWLSEQFAPVLADVSAFITDKVVPAMQEIASWVRSDGLPALQDLADKFTTYVLPVLSVFVEALIGVWRTAVDMGLKVAGVVLDVVAGFGRLKDGASDKLGAAVDTVRGFPGRVRDAVGDLGSMLYGAGSDIVQGLIDGIMSKIQPLVNAASAIANAIPGPVKSILGVSSPSKVMMAIGADTMEGLRLGLANNPVDIGGYVGLPAGAAVPAGGRFRPASGGATTAPTAGRSTTGGTGVVQLVVNGRQLAEASLPALKQLAWAGR